MSSLEATPDFSEKQPFHMPHGALPPVSPSEEEDFGPVEYIDTFTLITPEEGEAYYEQPAGLGVSQTFEDESAHSLAETSEFLDYASILFGKLLETGEEGEEEVSEALTNAALLFAMHWMRQGNDAEASRYVQYIDNPKQRLELLDFAIATLSVETAASLGQIEQELDDNGDDDTAEKANNLLHMNLIYAWHGINRETAVTKIEELLPATNLEQGEYMLLLGTLAAKCMKDGDEPRAKRVIDSLFHMHGIADLTKDSNIHKKMRREHEQTVNDYWNHLKNVSRRSAPYVYRARPRDMRLSNGAPKLEYMQDVYRLLRPDLQKPKYRQEFQVMRSHPYRAPRLTSSIRNIDEPDMFYRLYEARSLYEPSHYEGESFPEFFPQPKNSDKDLTDFRTNLKKYFAGEKLETKNNETAEVKLIGQALSLRDIEATAVNPEQERIVQFATELDMFIASIPSASDAIVRRMDLGGRTRMRTEFEAVLEGYIAAVDKELPSVSKMNLLKTLEVASHKLFGGTNASLANALETFGQQVKNDPLLNIRISSRSTE